MHSALFDVHDQQSACNVIHYGICTGLSAGKLSGGAVSYMSVTRTM